MKRVCQDRLLQPKWRLKSKMRDVYDLPVGKVSLDEINEKEEKLLKRPAEYTLRDLDGNAKYNWVVADGKIIGAWGNSRVSDVVGNIGRICDEHEGEDIRAYVTRSDSAMKSKTAKAVGVEA